MFVMPNPWDRGSALQLEKLGFKALATSSAGLGRSIGKDDQQVTRPELIQHVAELTEVLTVPLSVDSERLYPGDAGGIAVTVRMLADAGAAGCSIEDYDPESGSIDPLEKAASAVAEAASACADHGLVLTARAENHLYGFFDIDDTIERLVAYRDAGAEVLYAPGLTEAADIDKVVRAVRSPINVLTDPQGPTLDDLAALGVQRVSTGSSLYNTSRRTLIAAAEDLIESGRSDFANWRK